MRKWFLIPAEIVEIVKDTFQRFIDNVEYNCRDRDVQPEAYSKWIRERLHDFETSINITDAIPEDFKNES